MKKALIFTIIMLTAGELSCLRAGAAEKPRTYEMKSVLMEAETGTVIKGSGSHDRVPQGTMCKLMTVLLAAEEVAEGNMSMDTVLTASAEASGKKGAVVWLGAGEEITLGEAFKSVIIGNANDAAAVIAEEIGGSEEGFAGMMNARAFELGMRDTVFRSAEGYDCEGQYSSAYDIALLCRELMKHEFLYDIMNTWTDRVRGGQTEVVNENRLVRSYDGIIGMKASHSDESGWCLAMAAKRDGKRFIAVVMGCGDKDARFTEAKSLMSVGFSGYRVTTPSFSGEFTRPIAVKGGDGRAVGVTAEGLEELVVPESAGEVATVVFLPEYLSAPVEKGQKVGSIGFYSGDTLLCEKDLVADETVRKRTFRSSFFEILHSLYK